jgi:hypothetical protein
VHRLEHARVGARHVEVAAGGQADAAGHRGRHVGEDVAEQVVGDDHVVAAGVGEEEHRRRVDVLVGHGDLGELRRHLLDGARPQRPGVGQHVGLVDQRQVLARPADRPLEGVADDPLDTEGGVQADLGGHLVRGVAAQHPAGARVGPLGALPDAEHVDVTGLGERAADAVVEPRRPQVHVVVELEAQLEQQPALEDAAGHGGVADRAEQDRVVPAELVEHRVGQQLAGALPAGGPQVVRGGLHVRGDLAEHLEALGHHLRADAVSRDHCQPHEARG